MPDGDRAKKGRVIRGTEAIAERPDGSRIWFAPYPTPLRDARGRIVGGINMLVDITERKRVEMAAMRLAAVVRSSHDAIAAKDLNGIITDWNQSAERIFGYKAKEIIGKSVLTLIPKDRQSEETKILRKIRRGESIDHYQTVRRRKDGRLIDVSLTISPVKDAKGKIVGVSKVARDITKQKQTEQRLTEQTRLLDLSNEAILVRDGEDRDHLLESRRRRTLRLLTRGSVGQAYAPVATNRTSQASDRDFKETRSARTVGAVSSSTRAKTVAKSSS